MFHRVLVPLDGSPESEAVLPEMKRLAAGDARLMLLHVQPTPTPPMGSPPTQVFTITDQAYDYLDRVAGDLQGYDVKIQVREGDAAEEIGHVVREFDADLVAMTTHARGGLSRLLLGSVATEVVWTCAPPVLLVRPGQWAPSHDVRRILVPVETDHDAFVVDTVRPLALDAGAEVVLLHVIPVVAMAGMVEMSPLLPGDVFVGPETHVPDRIASTLASGGIRARAIEVHGNPVEEILKHARSLNVDLIVMGTQGRHGLERIILGSVAEGVVRGMDRAVLLQRAAN